MDSIEIVLGLLFTVALLAIAARRVRIPYPIFLVLGGLGLGLVPGLPPLELDPHVVFLLFLPPILHAAAVEMPWRGFKANLRPISLLAIGLVLFTTVTVAMTAHYVADLPWAEGFILGAIVSPPDAIAATAVMQTMKLPRRIVTILEGESLVNDATGLVAYNFAVTAVLTGTFSLPHATLSFFYVGLGGMAIGLVVGWIMTQIHRRLRYTAVEITFTLLTPFLSYIPADRLGVSGVLAVVTAGLYLARQIPTAMTPHTRLQAASVWKAVVFLINGLVFILIGFQLPHVLPMVERESWGEIIKSVLAVSATAIVVRIAWVFPASYLPRLLNRKLRKEDPYPDWRHVAIVSWAGMRGVVSLAAAIALPMELSDGEAFVDRPIIVFISFCVILATLIFQGLTLRPFIRLLGVGADETDFNKEVNHARTYAAKAALARIEKLADEEQLPNPVLERLRAEYKERLEHLGDREAEELGWSEKQVSLVAIRRLRRAALAAERGELIELLHREEIGDEVLHLIQHELDLEESRMGK